MKITLAVVVILTVIALDLYISNRWAIRRWFYRNVYLKTPHWQRVRKAALKRAGYKCEICGASNVPLDVHHEVYKLWREKQSDLMAVCRRCHNAIHSQKGK